MRLRDYLPELPKIIQHGERLAELTNFFELSKSGDIYRSPTFGIDQIVSSVLRQQTAYRYQMIEDLNAIAMTVEEIRAPLNHITSEVFRRGIQWKPKFAFRCIKCDIEYNEGVKACRKCGGISEAEYKRQLKEFEEQQQMRPQQAQLAPELTMQQQSPAPKLPSKDNITLVEPNEEQKERLDEFLDDANLFDNSLEEILRGFHLDLNALDDAFLYIGKEYIGGDDLKQPIHSKVIELRKLRPSLVEYDLDQQGLPKNSHFICYLHREDAPEVEPGICGECGRQLVPAMYVFWHRGAKKYLIDSEIIHVSKFSPCYDEETEILTRDGWKKFTDVSFEDDFATLSKDGYLEWQKPTNIMKFDHDAQMWRAENKFVDLLVTPNHKIYGMSKKTKNPKHIWRSSKRDVFKREEYSLVEAKEIPDDIQFRMTATMKWRGEEKETFTIPGYKSNSSHSKYNWNPVEDLTVSMDDWLEFLGYWLAEGTVVKENSVATELTQSWKKNPDVCIDMRNCLDRMNIHWTDGHASKAKIRIYHAGIAKYLRQFGYSKDRFIPREYKDLGIRQLRILLNALIRGDGSGNIDHPLGYKSISKRLLEDVAEIALKCGFRVYFMQNGSEIAIRNSLKGRNPILKPGTFGLTEEIYNGKVYCVEVPNHLLYVRRNGKLVWSGNSETYGWSPIMTIFEKALTLVGMDRNLYRYFFERKMPASMIMVFTDDPESLRRERANMVAQMRQDPNYIPMLAVSTRQNRGRVDFVKLFHTLQEMEYLPVRQEIRERIAAMWGVTPAWQGAPDAFGGLSAQSTQLTVMSRVVEGDQRIFHEKVFPQILDAFGVTDWELELPQPEEKAEATRLMFAQQRIASAAQLLQMGFDIKIKSPDVGLADIDFVISGEAMNPQDMMGGMGGFGGGGMSSMGGMGSPEGMYGEGGMTQPMEASNPNLGLMQKSRGLAKGWMQQVMDAGYSSPMFKQIKDSGDLVWFSSDGGEYVARFQAGCLTGIEKATFTRPTSIIEQGRLPEEQLPEEEFEEEPEIAPFMQEAI